MMKFLLKIVEACVLMFASVSFSICLCSYVCFSLILHMLVFLCYNRICLCSYVISLSLFSGQKSVKVCSIGRSRRAHSHRLVLIFLSGSHVLYCLSWSCILLQRKVTDLFRVCQFVCISHGFVWFSCFMSLYRHCKMKVYS